MDADKNNITNLYNTLAEYFQPDEETAKKFKAGDYVLSVKELQQTAEKIRNGGKTTEFHRALEQLDTIQATGSLKRQLDTMHRIDAIALKSPISDSETPSGVILKRKAEEPEAAELELPESHRKVSCLRLEDATGTFYNYLSKATSVASKAASVAASVSSSFWGWAFSNPPQYQIGKDSKSPMETTDVELTAEKAVEKEQVVTTTASNLSSPMEATKRKFTAKTGVEEEVPLASEEEHPIKSSKRKPKSSNKPDVEKEQVVTMRTDSPSDNTAKSSLKKPDDNAAEKTAIFANKAQFFDFAEDAQSKVKPKEVQIKKAGAKGNILTPAETRHKIPDIDKFQRLTHNRHFIDKITGLQDQASKYQVESDELNIIIGKMSTQQSKKYKEVIENINEERSKCQKIYGNLDNVRDNLKLYWIIEAADEKDYKPTELRKLAKELLEIGKKENYPTDFFKKNLSLNDIKNIANNYKNRELSKLERLEEALDTSSNRIEQAKAIVPREVEDD